MFHYVQAIQDTKGNALTGYYVGLVDTSTNTSIVIYADSSATPIISDSGVANLAKVDSDGNASLFCTAGTYHVDIYASDATTLVKRLSNIPMLSGEPGTAASVSVGTVTTLAAGASATVTNSGTGTAAVLNFGIPQGTAGSAGSIAWGGITGTLSNQTDLQTALNLKATIASPTFTGVPAAPTASAGTNTTQLATTAYVVASFAPLAAPTFTGVVTIPTAAAADSSTKAASTAYVQTELVNYITSASAASTYAPLSSPSLSGTPTAPTAASATNTTQIATTAYVKAQAYATLASPTFTGTPLSTTAAGGTNTTQIATTAFVTSAVAAVVGSAYLTITSFSANRTASDSDNNSLLRHTGAVAGHVLTLNSTPTAGCSIVVANRASVTLSISCATGIYLNGASTTVTTVTAAAGAHFTLIHEGTGVWTADGSGLS